jgi:hypothetical protein
MCGGYSARAHQFGYSRESVIENWNRRAPHPDTRRLDLVEQHGLEPIRARDGWAISAEPGTCPFTNHHPTARDAIDAAEKVLKPEPKGRGESDAR